MLSKMLIPNMLALVCLIIFIKQSHCLKMLTWKDAYMEIDRIVQSNPPPKGIPFPTTIPSPRGVNDKIAIVGAGPAGIHMAYLLKKKGFQNVVVFEKTDRIGGKSLTVKHRNTLHEMGTCYTQPDYDENIIAMAKEYGLWDPAYLPPASNNWLDAFPKPIEYSSYVIKEIKKILKTGKTTVAQIALFKAMVQYCALHRNMFGKYKGVLMRQPDQETMATLSCTFEEFLIKNNLLVLKPMFIATHTILGYGHLDEISALYGLMWNTPVHIKALVGKFIGVSHGLNMIRGGFQNMWETVVEKENINVILNADILKVTRYNNSVYLDLQYPDGHGWYRNNSYFNFLIWTPSVYTTLPRLDACRKERKLFSKLKPAWFSTTLFSSTYGTRGNSPIDQWPDNVKNKREHSLWAQRDSYGTLNNYYGEAYKNGSLPGGPDGQFIRTGVAYQYGKRRPHSKYCLKNILTKNLQTTGVSNIQIVRQEIWEYFPKFSPDDMVNGALWNIFKMQGSRRTWFAGSSVNCESVKSVLEYNKLLVSKMKDITL